KVNISYVIRSRSQHHHCPDGQREELTADREQPRFTCNRTEVRHEQELHALHCTGQRHAARNQQKECQEQHRHHDFRCTLYPLFDSPRHNPCRDEHEGGLACDDHPRRACHRIEQPGCCDIRHAENVTDRQYKIHHDPAAHYAVEAEQYEGGDIAEQADQAVCTVSAQEFERIDRRPSAGQVVCEIHTQHRPTDEQRQYEEEQEERPPAESRYHVWKFPHGAEAYRRTRRSQYESEPGPPLYLLFFHCMNHLTCHFPFQ